ncbi:hypothetical protein EniLVp02_0218 [Vibrio phage EniLVp02]
MSTELIDIESYTELKEVMLAAPIINGVLKLPPAAIGIYYVDFLTQSFVDSIRDGRVPTFDTIEFGLGSHINIRCQFLTTHLIFKECQVDLESNYCNSRIHMEKCTGDVNMYMSSHKLTLKSIDTLDITAEQCNFQNSEIRNVILSYGEFSRCKFGGSTYENFDMSNCTYQYCNPYERAIDVGSNGASLPCGIRGNLSMVTSESLSNPIELYQVSFPGHGEIGRTLSVMVNKDTSTALYYCGCFGGDYGQLMTYIDTGAPELVESRTLAVETIRQLMKHDAKRGIIPTGALA